MGRGKGGLDSLCRHVGIFCDLEVGMKMTGVRAGEG